MKIKLSTFITVIMLLFAMVNFPNIVWGADTGYPSGTALEKYAFEKNNPLANRALSTKLLAALEEEVKEVISKPRWAPYHEWFGIRKSSLAMTEPADVFYSLSVAYPYLSATTQSQVKTYLRNHWTTHQPYSRVDYATLRDGEARNWHRIDTSDYNGSNGHPVSNRGIQLYAIYLFAQNTDSWDLVSAQYSAIKSAFQSIPTTMPNHHDGNNSRNVSSVIGFIRIADHQDQSADVSAGLAKLQSLAQARIDHQRTEGTNCETSMDKANSGQFRSGGCLYAGGTHNGIISQYYGMTPELGRILRDYSTSASNTIYQWINRNAQGYWLVNGDTPVQEGEVHKPYYITTMSYFHIASSVQAADFTRHLQLADMPGVKADVYYIERLTRAIEASASQQWTRYDVAMKGLSTGTVVPTATPIITIPTSTVTPVVSLTQPPACPTDINQDQITDITDYSILVTNFLSTSPTNPRADINTDGIVDLSDYSMLVLHYLQSCGE